MLDYDTSLYIFLLTSHLIFLFAFIIIIVVLQIPMDIHFIVQLSHCLSLLDYAGLWHIVVIVYLRDI